VQDEIFSQAAGVLLSAALTKAEPKDLVAALAESADQHRIRIWSAHEDEEKLLAASSLGGALPTDDTETHVGVLFNDTTGGKMDYYTDAAISTAVGVCDGEPTTQVTVTWTNDAPADAATSLPPYVTAEGFYGVPAGSVRTLIAVYGPEGATPSHIDRDGKEESVQTALLGSRSAVQHQVLLAAGGSAGGRCLPLDERQGLGRRRRWSSTGWLGATSFRRWRRCSPGRRGHARRVAQVGACRRGSFRRDSEGGRRFLLLLF
jgi:hypothetical protein